MWPFTMFLSVGLRDQEKESNLNILLHIFQMAFKSQDHTE